MLKPGDFIHKRGGGPGLDQWEHWGIVIGKTNWPSGAYSYTLVPDSPNDHPFRHLNSYMYVTHDNSTVTVLNPKQGILDIQCEKTLKNLGLTFLSSFGTYKI